MIYGDGDNDNYLPFSGAKDVVAHEITLILSPIQAALLRLSSFSN
jgi:Zn-dependent metalloprotease